MCVRAAAARPHPLAEGALRGDCKTRAAFAGARARAISDRLPAKANTSDPSPKLPDGPSAQSNIIELDSGAAAGCALVGVEGPPANRCSRRDGLGAATLAGGSFWQKVRVRQTVAAAAAPANYVSRNSDAGNRKLESI